MVIHVNKLKKSYRSISGLYNYFRYNTRPVCVNDDKDLHVPTLKKRYESYIWRITLK